MTLTLGMITADTTDALRLARWWADQVGGTIEQEHDGWYVIVGMPGPTPKLAFQKVTDPTPGKNRLHLDLSAPDREAETERLVAAGATLVERQELQGHRWNVLSDPDGNQFCVYEAPESP
ncbi:VOC family protein [Aeromicrobium sp. NPDC092404]|uniref:VOC family protein n=1 Tax=Aeromicrobium sp. NPDC092404 TaxID=3154976 RepID=UPI003415A1BD